MNEQLGVSPEIDSLLDQIQQYALRVAIVEGELERSRSTIRVLESKLSESEEEVEAPQETELPLEEVTTNGKAKK